MKRLILGTAGVAIMAAILMLPNAARAALPAGFINSLVVSGLNIPTDFAFAPDGRMFVTEQSGHVISINNGQQIDALTLPVGTGGDRGLLSIVLDPNFSSNGFVYLLYTSPTFHERISKFTISGDNINPNSEHILLENAVTWNGFLNAGTLRFGPDGKLYASMGENGISSNAQDLSVLEGKMLRINSDGSIPSDNPFVNVAGDNPAIYAYGFRNPWHFNFAPDGRAIVGDVGVSTWDKIVRVNAGANYGWPMFEGDCTPNCNGVTPPLLALPHNGGGLAVVGGAVNTGTNFPSTLAGNYFFGDFVQGYFKYFGFDSNGNATALQTLDPANNGSTGAINFGPDGCLWYTNLFPGELHKICYGLSQAPVAVASADKNSGTLPLTINFSSASSTGVNLSYTWNFGDGSAISTSTNPSHVYTTQGVYHASLTVSNGNGSSTFPLTIWAGYLPPTPTISAPINNSNFNDGDTINYSGSATDPQDGTLAPAQLTWTIIFHEDTHIDPPTVVTGQSSGSYNIPTTTDEPTATIYYEFDLTATDSLGLSSTTVVNIFPNMANINLNSSPTGAHLLLDSTPVVAPYSQPSPVGLIHTVDVTSPQIIAGNFYNFTSWSDSGGQNHTITTPKSGLTLTANLTQSSTSPVTVCNTPPPAGGFNGCYYSDMNLGTLVLNRTDPVIGFLWNDGQSPDPSVPPYHWSASWTGNFQFNSGTYEFDMTVDDGGRVYIDGNKIIDAWKDQGATTYTVTQNLTAGTHTIRMEYYQDTGQSQAALVWKQVTTPPPPQTCPGPVTGAFTGCYYTDQTLTTLGLVRTDPAINFDWGNGSPDPSISADHFSAEWQGNFAFNAGTYQFSATADDGIRVSVDGNQIINGWVDQPPTTYTATTTLTAGTHLVTVQYYENTGGAVAQVSWTQTNTQTPPACGTPLSNSFIGCYFAGTNFNTFVATRTDPTINFVWNGATPAPGVPPQQFSVRWLGSFNFNAGATTFTAIADDGVRVYVDNTLVIDEWKDQPATTYTATANLTTGPHVIKVEYYQNTGGDVAIVSWNQTGPPPPQLPVINSFIANPSTITSGSSTVLSWQVTGATTISINQGVGDVSTVTSKTVSPAVTTTYTLTATNSSGSATSTAAVTVIPAQPPPNPTYSVTASLPSNSFSPASIGTITTTATSNVNVSNAIIDTEIYNGTFNKVAQNFVSANLAANQPYATTWNVTLPTIPGTYTIKVGLFTANWSSLLSWNDQAFTFTISSSTNNQMVILTPANNATVSGTVPVQAVIASLNISSYKIGWRTDPSGAFVDMPNDPTGSFKQNWINFASWTWNPNHTYPLEFRATDLSGNTLADQTINVIH